MRLGGKGWVATRWPPSLLHRRMDTQRALSWPSWFIWIALNCKDVIVSHFSLKKNKEKKKRKENPCLQLCMGSRLGMEVQGTVLFWWGHGVYRVLTVPFHYLPIFPKSLLYHNVQLKSPCEKTREVELDVSRRVVGLAHVVLFLSVTYKKT